MAKKLGNDYRLWIESAVAGTYNEIKGQQTLAMSRQSQAIDTTTKDNFPYGTQASGTKTLTIDVDLVPDLPDANGYTRLETFSKGSAPIKFQIRKNGSSGNSTTDVVFEANMYIGGVDVTYGQNDVIKAKTQLSLESAPVTDTLA